MGVAAYKKEIAQLNGDTDLWKMEVNSPGGYGRALMIVISSTLAQNPDRCVSSHVHICIVRRGDITISKSDYTRFDADGKQHNVQMPYVVTSWPEFQGICDGVGADAKAAIC